jgi:hypothetical protein
MSHNESPHYEAPSVEEIDTGGLPIDTSPGASVQIPS